MTRTKKTSKRIRTMKMNAANKFQPVKPSKTPKPADPVAPAEPPRVMIPVGARVEIDVNDDGCDKPGVIVYALPECGVVRLDKETSHGHRYVAADWQLIHPQDKGAPAPASPAPSGEDEPLGGLQYMPTLREWFMTSSPFNPEYINPHTFALFDSKQEKFSTRVKIATITIEKELATASAQEIATLIQHAPELWQALRETNRWLILDDAEQVKGFARNTQLLWEAGSHPPYDAPNLAEDDVINDRVSDEACKLLAGRKAAKL